MTEERKNELDKIINTCDIDAINKVEDPDEQIYLLKQSISKATGDSIKDDETRNNIIKDCVAQLDNDEDIDAIKAWLGTYSIKEGLLYAKYVFKLLLTFRTSDVEDMIKHFEEIKLLPRELLPKDILRRIDQLEKIKDMDPDELSSFIHDGIKMISTFIDNIMTVYKEYEIAFDIAKIALDLHVYSADGTLIHTRATTHAIEEAYAKNNK